MESWFLQQQLPIFNIDNATIIELANYKYQYDLGVLTNLPDIDGYTEIVLSQQPVPVFHHQKREAKKLLNIKATVNLAIPKFDRGIVPTKNELHELIEYAIEDLHTGSDAIIIF